MQYQEYEDSFLASPSHDTQPTVSGTLPLSASQPGLIYEDYPVASIPTTVNVLPVAPEAADIQAAQIQTMMAQASFVDSPQKLIQPSSGSGSSTVEVPRVTIPMQGLISVRFTRGGGSYKAIRHSDVQKWSVLRTTDQRSEISNPHIGGKPGTLPRVLFLAKAEEMERAFKPYIYDLIPGARLKLVILACPICGHCTEEHGIIGAQMLRAHMDTHDEFQTLFFVCLRLDLAPDGQCGETFSTLSELQHRMETSENM